MMKVGFIGTGWIAERMAQTLNAMAEEGIFLTAAGSRTIEKAEEFAARFNIKEAYGSYEELVNS
ncbi:MAG: Gfo/Idh/MocA family oxidoreductase, partial [Oscillospiraceae bacterium]|nr:Gfo/Idh/MocA family oxidoreductase [Oscillospiraceae bacterium]